jgi:uncharacterized protein YdiU (UPF0061 family)
MRARATPVPGLGPHGRRRARRRARRSFVSSASSDSSRGVPAEGLIWREEDDFVRRFCDDTDADARAEVCARCRPTPTGVEATIGCVSASTARLLGMETPDVYDAGFAALASGNADWSSRSHACAYAGHQFGQWAGRLGDGRAHNIGTVIGGDGETLFDVQLKGSGKTPYSRNGDGRAVLRSSLREYVASEAMAALGVPTTRSLALCATNDGVVRMTASNYAVLEPGAVMTRVTETPGFVRFGSFEWLNSKGDDATTRKLLDYVIDSGMYSQEELSNARGTDARGSLLVAVARRTGALVAKWQSLGFTHGVLNTDNMSIAGVTLDYGPFGFMEGYDIGYTPNSSDDERMYSYANQPAAVRWNVERLCDALTRVVDKRDRGRALEAFDEAFRIELYATYTRKFGIWVRDDEEFEIVRSFQRILQRGAFDFTTAHRYLGALASTVVARGEYATAPSLASEMFVAIHAAMERADDPFSDDVLRVQIAEFGDAYAQILLREDGDEDARRAAQDSTNPLYVPRNHLLQEAIERATAEDWEYCRCLCEALSDPFERNEAFDEFARPANPAENARCSRLS